MLIPNLSVLLAERRLTLSKVSEDTHISRTTLTALTGRSAKGVQFDTLNTLCQYLRVTPGELFLYRPFDLAAEVEGLPGRSVLRLTVSRAGGASDVYALACDAEYRFGPKGRPPLERLVLRLSLPADADPTQGEALLSLLQALPRPALTDLELQILRRFDARIPPELAPDDYTPEIRWPWQ